VRLAHHGDWFWLNLFFARVTPFKYIFLTGQHNLYLSALLTVTLKALGYSDMTTIIVGSILLGLAACLYPAIAQPWMRKSPVMMKLRWGTTYAGLRGIRMDRFKGGRS
jgi:hypothetical protein